MNLVAKDLKIPLDIEAAVRALTQGIRRQIDVGKVGEVVFLCNSVIGLAPLLARQRERERGLATPAVIRWARVAVATLKSLVRFRSRRLTIRYGETTRHLRTKALTISVNPYDEDASTLFRRSVLDGGELATYIAPDISAIRLIGGVLRLIAGKGTKAAGLERHKLRAITVASRHRHLVVMNDGEPMLLPTPLHYRILPRQLTVLVPREPAEPTKHSLSSR
jgi:diacylglycerol kinase family enzyme